MEREEITVFTSISTPRERSAMQSYEVKVKINSKDRVASTNRQNSTSSAENRSKTTGSREDSRHHEGRGERREISPGDSHGKGDIEPGSSAERSEASPEYRGYDLASILESSDVGGDSLPGYEAAMQDQLLQNSLKTGDWSVPPIYQSLLPSSDDVHERKIIINVAENGDKGGDQGLYFSDILAEFQDQQNAQLRNHEENVGDHERLPEYLLAVIGVFQDLYDEINIYNEMAHFYESLIVQERRRMRELELEVGNLREETAELRETVRNLSATFEDKIRERQTRVRRNYLRGMCILL